MTTSLGWKDVLRPIRDGYRHLFPTPDSGPTPEERQKRREQDKLKGFTYFDTFEQVESWTESESDILQRANTPLLVRRSIEESNRNSRAPLMLCHDYAGNYHDYEDAKSIGVEEPLYACEYLQYVDSFVYFSHKLVCVPPPTWINIMHRNGVKTLGTMIFEPQTENTERILQHTGDGAEMLFPFAKKLASISRHYGFDGWLINIEKPFPKEHWSPDVLTGFLNNLRAELGDGMELVWYDALTTSNEVYYQNGLNLANLPFAEACGKVLTNYCWNARQAQDSAIVAAAQSDFGLRNVFMGIDVWAQNATWYSHPRTTYPRSNGGGTNTSIAVARSGEFGLSACAFGPAWSYEHFPGRGRELERTVWEDEPLPPDLTCSCGSATSRHKPEGFGLTANAKLFPAGSEKFFYTDLSRAFGLNASGDTGKLFKGRWRTQLGTQSLLPIPAPQEDRSQQSRLSHRLQDEVDQSHLVIDCHNGVTTENPTNRYFNRWLPLYKVDMPANGSLHITVKGQNLITDEDGVPSVYLKFSGETKRLTQQGHNPRLVPFTQSTPSSQTAIIFKNSFDHDARLEEIGVHLAGYSGEGVVPVMKISEISITPKEHIATLSSHAISNLRVERRGAGENGHMRLCWNIQEHVVGVSPRLEGLPYSEITGPFSYFEVKVHGLGLGRAYSTEHVLSKEVLELIRGQEIEVRVTGFGFDGRQLAEEDLSFHLE